ncbi:hypothetical protein DCAR_0934602 [Daucus carota subsp. sativus]|uniref:Uncharacterized protein n=1 Tax=Daucus carota subsp. sativus TaxID=79200 RepID=A0A175YA19_DAUCS|nr:hypothetical protein DCAR_0934602 [Daucus carota subsp. sativus]
MFVCTREIIDFSKYILEAYRNIAVGLSETYGIDYSVS